MTKSQKQVFDGKELGGREGDKFYLLVERMDPEKRVSVIDPEIEISGPAGKKKQIKVILPRSKYPEVMKRWQRTKGTEDKKSTGVNKFIWECAPEVDQVYEVIYHKGFGPRNTEELRKKRALKFFDGHKRKFIFIKREMLEDDLLYRVSLNLAKPHFRQKLFAKLIEYWLPQYKIKTTILRKKIAETLH